mgnify:CR=1 FL=1
MKRFLKLAITIAWLTAPLAAFWLCCHGKLNTGSYPFFGICSWLYEFLYRSTDLTFVLVILGTFVFWVAMYAASLLVSRYSPLKFALCSIALLDLVIVSICAISHLTVVWDVLFICSTLIVGKKKMPAQSSSPARVSALAENT